MIEAGELRDVLGTVRLLDVRWQLGGPPGIEDYRKGHIPGAVFCDLQADLSDPASAEGRHPLPSPERFQAAMRRLGVRNDVPVVVYDGETSMAAARAWWALRYFGHPDVRVLNGGVRAWGSPLETDDPEVEPGDFTAVPGHLPTVDAAGAGSFAGVLLDARAAERYRGETEPIDPVAGHIPGAVSAPTTENVGPDGRFLDPARLRGRFEAAGVRPGAPVGAYCGSGVTAAHEILALEVAGFPGAVLYPGSWSNWVADPARPVATGPTP
ncbi:sulfurtransferase [Bailinhaonella thermotolerans]|uniref:Sulfurtransferase n=1 Tax=Bailinhaonella thermotolerans TaxID=1070861 RepID=A0A3A4B397_9ACTN|nr:sulfurtransferase [Bailinhaonella thermotolerans]RJL34668.1 sulfurtransferase [Bailinhaonella thermotolerans]